MAAVALGLFLQLSGCLNPRPEELPSGSSSPNTPGFAERETCESNPQLGGCELPDSDINAGPGDGDLSDNPSDAEESGAPASAPENLSGGGDRDGGAAASTETDAGSLGNARDASDAGAP